jgi:hypothetical protein
MENLAAKVCEAMEREELEDLKELDDDPGMR